MNTARSSFARIGGGVFSAVLGAVLLVMIAALFAADQSQSRAGRARARIDATDLGVAIEQIVAARISALGAVRGAFVSPEEGRGSALEILARGALSDSRGTLALWVTDSAGRIVYDTTLAPAPLSARSDRSALAGRVTRLRSPFVALGDRAGGERALVIATPLLFGERVVGAAGGVYTPSLLFAQVIGPAHAAGESVVLRAGGDTVAASPRLPGKALSNPESRELRLAGDAGWEIVVRTVVDARGTRIALWGLGLVAVVFLGVGVIRERRQAIRISERSAELERLSTELLRANRMKSEFLANVSHELRTPLNAIVGFVDLLREGVYGELSPRQVPPVDRIAASATHLRHLVDQVLDIAKIAAGRLEVHPEVIALRPFVLNVASELESLIAERELTLSITVPATLPRVRTDPGHLRQILVNLIGNAVKYTPAGGLGVRARFVGGHRGGAQPRGGEDHALAARSPDGGRSWVVLQVIDSGIGIASADQERIFEEFEQVDAGPRGESMQRGTGLGLAISRRLARLLGGDITVDSQVGRGSTFTVWLPAYMADLESRPEEAPAADASRQLSA